MKQFLLVTFFLLQLQSCKLYDQKYVITSIQITSTKIFVFIVALVFKLLRTKFCLCTEKTIETINK